MKFNLNRKAVVYVLVALIIVMGIITLLNWPACHDRQLIDASITVHNIGSRAYLGLNTDTQNLSFGGASPGTEIIRSIILQNKDKAEVKVRMLGEISPWTKIDPNNFTISPDEQRSIFFTVSVPVNALNGDYTGKAEFCFDK